MDKKEYTLDNLVMPEGWTWQDTINAESFKRPCICIDCDEIHLKHNSIEITFGTEDLSKYEYIEVNGIKFKQEKE